MMTSTNARKYDIIVFGATGFTGEFVVEELSRVAGAKTWAVAGRNEAKVREALKKASDYTGSYFLYFIEKKFLAMTASLGKNLTTVDIIVADAANFDSIVRMVQQCRVVVNCVGPV